MMKYLTFNTAHIAVWIMAAIIMVLLGVTSLDVAYGTVCDNPGNPCGESSTSNPDACVGNPPWSCGNGSDSGGTVSTEGQSCQSAANACGVKSTGVINGGRCTTRVRTGTNSKGNPTYAYVPISAPANPANYGSTCQSAANACGSKNTGTIGCNGACSAKTPSLPTGYGTSCQSAANACGSKNTGTISCNGKCSVSTPALPAGYGTACSSPVNACGSSNTGTIGCNGQCSVSTSTSPSLPSGYGTSCQSAANSCGQRNTGVIQCSGSCSASAPSENMCAPDATQTIKATPGLVQKGGRSTVTWTSTNAESCTVAGTNGDSWSGTSGTRQTSAITGRVTYTITCTGINTNVITKSIIVDLVPIFQEL